MTDSRRKSKSAASERRHYPRLHGVPLMANIAGRLVQVIDVSAKGVTLEKAFVPLPGVMTFTLYPFDGERLQLNKGVRATGVVSHSEADRIGIRFEPASLALVKLVVEKAS
jgi:hypothetical protein